MTTQLLEEQDEPLDNLFAERLYRDINVLTSREHSRRVRNRAVVGRGFGPQDIPEGAVAGCRVGVVGQLQ
jgi:hypothetical protein